MSCKGRKKQKTYKHYIVNEVMSLKTWLAESGVDEHDWPAQNLDLKHLWEQK